jgi:hypothetical protein
MFEHNNTQNFMNALFTEFGDFKFLHEQACAYKGRDQAKQKEMVVCQQEKNQKQDKDFMLSTFIYGSDIFAKRQILRS